MQPVPAVAPNTTPAHLTRQHAAPSPPETKSVWGCVRQDGWLDVARPRIQQRMQQYSEGEIRFNLMALIRDRRAVAMEQLAALAARAEQLQACACVRPTCLAVTACSDPQLVFAQTSWMCSTHGTLPYCRASEMSDLNKHVCVRPYRPAPARPQGPASRHSWHSSSTGAMPRHLTVCVALEVRSLPAYLAVLVTAKARPCRGAGCRRSWSGRTRSGSSGRTRTFGGGTTTFPSCSRCCGRSQRRDSCSR